MFCLAGAHPQTAVEELHVEVALFELLLVFLATAAVPRKVGGAEVLVEVAVLALLQESAEGAARIVDAARNALLGRLRLQQLRGRTPGEFGATASQLSGRRVHQDRIRVARIERIRLPEQRPTRVDLAARVDRANGLTGNAVTAARSLTSAEAATRLAAEVEERRVVIDRAVLEVAAGIDCARVGDVATGLEDPVRAQTREEAHQAIELLATRRQARIPVDQDRPVEAGARIENRLEAERREARHFGLFGLHRVRPVESLIADEGCAIHAGAMTARLVAGQVHDAIAECIRGRKYSAGARPHAVVANFESHVGGENVERTPAVGCEVVLRLDVQDVVPLREVDVVGPGEVLGHGADRLFEVAVDLQTAVLEVEGFRARRQCGKGRQHRDRERAGEERELEARTHASRRHRGHGPPPGGPRVDLIAMRRSDPRGPTADHSDSPRRPIRDSIREAAWLSPERTHPRGGRGGSRTHLRARTRADLFPLRRRVLIPRAEAT